MSTHCIVTTTFSSSDQAAPVVRTVVEERLAACAQAFGISSTYVWNGELEQVPELLVQFKTRIDRYPALEARLRKLHPYDVPEIVAVPITAGSDDYLAWIDEQTAEFR